MSERFDVRFHLTGSPRTAARQLIQILVERGALTAPPEPPPEESCDSSETSTVATPSTRTPSSHETQDTEVDSDAEAGTENK